MSRENGRQHTLMPHNGALISHQRTKASRRSFGDEIEPDCAAVRCLRHVRDHDIEKRCTNRMSCRRRDAQSLLCAGILSSAGRTPTGGVCAVCRDLETGETEAALEPRDGVVTLIPGPNSRMVGPASAPLRREPLRRRNLLAPWHAGKPIRTGRDRAGTDSGHAYRFAHSTPTDRIDSRNRAPGGRHGQGEEGEDSRRECHQGGVREGEAGARGRNGRGSERERQRRAGVSPEEDREQALREGAVPAPGRACEDGGVDQARRAQGGSHLRGARRGRQGRGHQAHHPAPEPAHLPGRGAARPDRARADPVVLPTLRAAPARRRRDGPVRSELVQPGRRGAGHGLLHRRGAPRVPAYLPGVRTHARAIRHQAHQVLVLRLRRGAGRNGSGDASPRATSAGS